MRLTLRVEGDPELVTGGGGAWGCFPGAGVARRVKEQIRVFSHIFFPQV